VKLNAKKIFLRCAELGISQREMLRRMGSTGDLMTRINRGAKISARILHKLSETLRVEPDELLADD